MTFRPFRFASLIAAGAALALATATTFAQAPAAPAPTVRIGLISTGSIDLRAHLEQALLDGLRAEGLVEGVNLLVERRYADGVNERLPVFASEVALMKLDAVVTTCTLSTRAAKASITDTPIVMLAVSDPVANGLIASLARPGRNITGVSSQAEEIMPKMLELFSSVLPRRTTVAVLANAGNAVHKSMWNTLAAPGQSLDLKLVRIEIRSPADLPAAFDSAVAARAGALFVLADDPLIFNLRARIVDAAARLTLPDFYWSSEFVEAGGLMSYGENLGSSYRDGARYVAKVVRGARPEDLPVAQPTRFELTLNARTAKSHGIALPQSLLVRADRVIE